MGPLDFASTLGASTPGPRRTHIHCPVDRKRWRFCIDFRCLNARTKKDSHPLPRGPEMMESLVGARYFSTMDLKSGFWQVKKAEESRQYTRLHRRELRDL